MIRVNDHPAALKMRYRCFFTWSFFFLLVFNAFSNQKPDFVKVKGTHFEINGQPYYFTGTNLWFGANLGADTEGGGRKRLIRELNLLKSLGLNNLRILGASEGPGEFRQIKPAIQPEPGIYDENVLVGLDFLLDEMSKRGMYAVIFLNNYWEWSGGMAQYVSWHEGVRYPNPNQPEHTWDQFMQFSGRFYTHDLANASFRQYLRKIIERKNTVNGRLYREDPTIMSWQLANEPRPHPGQENRDQHLKDFIAWVEQTAAFIKSLDPNHLVSTGNEGLAGSLGSESCYLESHASPHIDYLTFHIWLLNWGWFDPQNPEQTYPEAEKKALAYLHQHIEFARQVGKPTTLEEFGIPRDQHAYSPQAATKYRDRYFKTMLTAIHNSAASGSPMAGSNFWAWGGFGIASDPEGQAIWQPGDDFVGDPPQEPQGRNSIFSTDQSTLKILAKQSKAMQALSRKKRKP